MNESCQNCRFFLDDELEEEFDGWCRRYPKVLPKDYSWWCGEWSGDKPIKVPEFL